MLKLRTIPSQSLMILLLATAFLSGPAAAQATRTWVSGVGDDANPCSRTAPCKTFAGAISKTAAGGEISVLDPGGYGAVTITKSITIDGTGTLASILAAGTHGVTVNTGAADIVTLRNISIHGAGTGLTGIRFIQGGTLHVDGVTVTNFSIKGMEFAPTVASRLFVSGSSFKNNRAASGGGMLIRPGATGSAFVTLDEVQLENNYYGLRAESRSTVHMRNCIVSGNTYNGLLMLSGTDESQMTADNCTISSNGFDNSTAGVKATGSAATIYLSNNSISDNSVGLLKENSGEIISFGNNAVAGNGLDGTPSSTFPTR